jgi:hypothetical protein
VVHVEHAKGPNEEDNMIIEMIYIMRGNGRRQGDRKGNLRAPFSSLHQDMDQPASTTYGAVGGKSP